MSFSAPAEKCGICGERKSLVTYNAKPQGVAMQHAELCTRCDLTPEPPQVRR